LKKLKFVDTFKPLLKQVVVLLVKRMNKKNLLLGTFFKIKIITTISAAMQLIQNLIIYNPHQTCQNLNLYFYE